MWYILESIFVGLYCVIIYTIVNLFLSSRYFFSLLLITGFLKHYVGYYLGLHEYYYHYGEQCLKIRNKEGTRNIRKIVFKTGQKILLIQSGIEAILFIIVGYLFHWLFKNLNYYILFFIIGFSLHIMAEFLGIHKWFCRHIS